MMVLIVILLGAISLRRLPIDLMPDITYPTLNIYTSYENAAPEEIEELVTHLIEQAVSAVPGVEEISSFSMEGQSTVRVAFAWGTDLDDAANDIRDRLDRVIPRLPENADRPTLRKYDPASFPILILGAYGKQDLIELRRIIDDRVRHRIERIPGVAAVDVWGGLVREIHVNLNEDRVKALGLPLNQIVSQIKSGNINIPGGALERGNLEVIVRTPGEYRNIDELKDAVIAIREGATIQLREIASIEEAWAKERRIIRINRTPGIRLAVRKQSGANTVNVARVVLQEVERINQDMPQINLTPVVDSSNYIQRSITNVGSSALYGSVLAVLVLLFFLRNIRSTIVIATAIPISIIATFALMYFSGFTLNIMTLGGLALGVGMMVDSAIVVLENIYRLRESGEAPEQAAVNGSEEVTSAIIAGTLTTLAVFLPLIFVRGMVGVMFKQLAYIISFSLLCSLFVALTLVPMLCARIFQTKSPGGLSKWQWTHKIYEISEEFFTRLNDGYRQTLHFALNNRKLIIVGAIGLLAVSIALIPLVGSEFMPATDEGEVRVSGEMEVGTRLDVLSEKFRAIEAIVKDEIPEAKNMLASLGVSRREGSGTHMGQLQIALKSRAERSQSSEEVAALLRQKLSSIPGIKIRTRAGQGLFILRMGMEGTEEKVQVEIQGYDLQKANVLAEQVKQAVEQVDGVTDVVLSQESGGPEELFNIDRQKAADMKVTVSEVANMLQTTLTGAIATYYREAGEEIPIRVKLKDAERMNIRDILDLALTNADGEPVILRNLVKVSSQIGPVHIDHKNQERIVTVSANISGRDMGSVLVDIRERLRAVPVPHDFSVAFGGEYEEQQKAFRELLLSFILALLLVYMVMASLYESLRHPFVVMFSVPLATIGVVLMLFLSNTTFNVQSYIGCIMLGGIVVNNAILLVDYTNLLRRRDRMPLRDAIEEAGRRRLRPILMTTMTTVTALIPLALGFGEGGEAQAPLARAVIGGLLSSTIITLVFIPTVYSIVEELIGKRNEKIMDV
jgi:HAE1 family hydrophobic/amphiphilic exporter-1